MRENRISVFRKHTLGILVALGMVLFGSVFILFTNIIRVIMHMTG